MSVERTFDGKLGGVPRYSVAAATLVQAKAVQCLELPDPIKQSTAKCSELRGKNDLQAFFAEFSQVNEPLVDLAKNASLSTNGDPKKVFRFPWAGNVEPDCSQVWRSLVVYSDTLNRGGENKLGEVALSIEKKFPLPEMYLPKEEISKILYKFESHAGPLDLETQFRLVSQNPEDIWSTSYLLALFWRGVSRNEDSSLGLNEIGFDRKISLIQRLPVLPDMKVREVSGNDKTIATNGGNWYHFYTTLSGLLGPYLHEEIKKESAKFRWYDRFKMDVYNLIMNHTPLIAAIRKKSDYPCGLHKQYDERGARMAEICYQIITGNNRTHDVNFLKLTGVFNFLQENLIE